MSLPSGYCAHNWFCAWGEVLYGVVDHALRAPMRVVTAKYAPAQANMRPNSLSAEKDLRVDGIDDSMGRLDIAAEWPMSVA